MGNWCKTQRSNVQATSTSVPGAAPTAGAAPIPRPTPGSIALERLYQALHERGIHPARDHDNGQLVYLHTSTVSISVQGAHFRLERVDHDGNLQRLILLTLARITDAARLVTAYEEAAAPSPGSDA